MLEKYKAYLNIILKRLAGGFARAVAAGMVIAVIITGSLSIQKQSFAEGYVQKESSEKKYSAINLLDMESLSFNALENLQNGMDGSEIDLYFDPDDSIMLFSLDDVDEEFDSSFVEPSEYAGSEQSKKSDDLEAEIEYMQLSDKLKDVTYALDNGELLDVSEQKKREQEQKAMEEAILKGKLEAEERRAEKERKEEEQRKAEEERKAAEKQASTAEEKKKTTGLKRLEEDEDADYDLSETLTYKYNRKMDIEITDEEYEVLCRIVEAEAGDQDVYGRILVANVILNRVRYKKEFANNIIDVVFEPNQFAPTRDGSYYTVKVDDLTKEAVNRATSGEDYSQGALYFFMRSATSASKASWFDTLKFLFKYGCHEFFK